MKLSIAIALSFVAACSSLAQSNDLPADQARSGFERLKTLEGKWVGAAEHGDGGGPVEISYHVTAAGSVVEERLFAGTPHEMVTMYHMDGDHLMLTHYCAAGNQPSMIARVEPNMDQLRFTCAGGTNMKSENDSHMHAGLIRFVDKDHIEETWSGVEGGKSTGDAHFALTRSRG